MTDLVDNVLSDVGALRTFLRARRSTRAAKRGALSPAVSAIGKPGAAPGGVTVVSRHGLLQIPAWKDAFGSQYKDRRYYEIVEDTIEPKFSYRYFIIRDDQGEVRAVQPAFIVEQDLLEGAHPRLRRLAALIRRAWPRFMSMRALMIGCAAGDGHLDGANEDARRSSAVQLLAAVMAHARADRVGLIVLKEFSARYRRELECFREASFIRLPSLPMTSLDIDYPSFDAYMARALSHATRKDLRRKFRSAARAPKIEMSVTHDISAVIDDVYPLYLQVYARSNRHFEKLTKSSMCELGRRMPEKTRFFIWRQNGRVIAFSICMVQGDTICDEYIGLDYSVALDLHLYHYTFRDIVSWAIANGYKRYRCTGLNYNPKLHLRHRLDPLDLYVRHRSGLVNVALKFALPLLEPTRCDEDLKHFANFHELRGAS